MVSLLPAARAKVSYDISPYAGLFVPLRSMFVCGRPACGWDGATAPTPQPGQGVALQKTIAVGGRVTGWPARRFGIEAAFGYAPSGGTIGCRGADCNAGSAVMA